MKFVENWKRFWTLNRHHAAGFTLVELIVVIAILAILAGVAVPAYSGYIAQANKAADEQLLDALNTAFASACAINGANHIGRKDVKNITLVEGAIPDTYQVVNEDIDASFDTFFEGGEFKVIKNLVYDMLLGGFKDPSTAETLVLAYGDGYVQVTGAAINALLNSTYYGEGMTSEKLMQQVDNVAFLAGGMGTIANVMNTEEYVNAALTALGITPTDSFEENVNLMNAAADRLAREKLGLVGEDLTASNEGPYYELLNDIRNNALVLYTAQSTSKMGAEEAKNLLNGINSGMIKDAMDGKLTEEDKAKGMNQAALAYGMYYAYVNSDYCTDENIKGDSDIWADEVIAALDSDDNSEFKKYMASEQGTKDMEAYLQALSVVNSSAQSPEAVEKLVVEGFASEDLIAILQGTMGK